MSPVNAGAPADGVAGETGGISGWRIGVALVGLVGLWMLTGWGRPRVVRPESGRHDG